MVRQQIELVFFNATACNFGALGGVCVRVYVSVILL